jgi:D-beta-D-heptose 7-phosphate kinase/D-beta-D-heptose 1-phosphate adenosyltransferase
LRNVFVNGTFDVIHPGHIELLNFAKDRGDHLTVAIDSTDRIRRLKGPYRPINTEYERVLILQNIRAVDHVVVFHTDEDLIKLVSKCDVMVKGSDYRGKPIVGESECKEILFYEIYNEYSTTKKIQHIISRG